MVTITFRAGHVDDLDNASRDDLDPPYGDKRDYRKIDLYECGPRGLRYMASTTWAKSCGEARERYASETGKELNNVRARYSR